MMLSSFTPTVWHRRQRVRGLHGSSKTSDICEPLNLIRTKSRFVKQNQARPPYPLVRHPRCL
jgi:hypothetical protein